MKETLTRWLIWMEARSKAGVLAFCVFASLLIGVLDYLSGYDMQLDILYLLPILVTGWRSGARPGIIIAVLCMACWLVAKLSAQGFDHRHPVLYWNGFVHFLTLLLVLALAVTVRSLLGVERRMASFDALTGARNVRSFYEALETEMYRCRRTKSPFSLAFLDLDKFKDVNDVFGHQRGDTLLATVADILRDSTRMTDTVGRLGGDEFAVLMAETDSPQAEVTLERIYGRLERTTKAGDFPVTFSCGVVTFLKVPASPEEAVHLADELMYRAKRSGGNRCEYQNWGL